MLNSNTYIHIEYWMTQLGLSLTELFIYAIIHGFSQDGKSYYSGSQKYFRTWTGKAKSTVILALNSLEKRKLIVKKAIRVDGKFYNTYYTTESRKPVEEKFATILNEKMSTPVSTITESENQTGMKIGPTKSENQTSEVRNSDLDGPKIGHNNIIYNTNNNAADSDNSSTDFIDSAIKAIISQKVTELFGSPKVFDSKFIEEIEESILETGLSEQQIESYLQFAFEKTCSKKPDSIPGLFRKIACGLDVLQDYILKHPQKTERKITYIRCPVCNTEFDELEGSCPICSLAVSTIKQNNEQEIAVHSTLVSMNDEQRAVYDNAYNIFAKSKGRAFLTPEERLELLKEQGFLQDKNKTQGEDEND